MHRSFLLVFFGVVVSCFTALADGSAGAQKCLVVGFLDAQRLVTESLVGKSATQQIQEKYNSLQVELKSTEESLKNRESELSQQRGVLSEEAFNREVEAFQKDVAALRQRLQEGGELLTRAQLKFKEALQQAIHEVSKEIATVTRKDGKRYSAIIEKEGVIYLDDSVKIETLDCTSEALRLLDVKMPSYEVSFSKE